MTDYIRRDTAIELMKKDAAEMSESFEKLGGESGIYADAYEDAANMLQDMPAADVAEVVHGKWENGNPICPVCGGNKFKDLDADIWCDWQPDFCPNCGAKMDGGEDRAVS